MRSLRIVLPACLLGIAAALPFGAAHAVPTDVGVTPRVAPMGTPVTVSGAGCVGNVQVEAVRYLWPGTPTTVVDVELVPDLGGAWQTTFPMPSEPATVVARCDGAASVPVAVAPNDITYSQNALLTVTDTEIVLGAAGLLAGTEYGIHDLTGALLGSSVVAGDGEVSVPIPRSLGAQPVLGVGVSLPGNSGVSEPFIPRVSRFELPLAADTALVVTRRVAVGGTTLTATGVCAGTPQVVVTGRTSGWYDVATIYVDLPATTGPNSTWTIDFATPPEPATVRVICTNGSATGSAAEAVTPVSGALPLTVAAAGSPVELLRIEPPADSAGPYSAWTADSTEVPLTVAGDGMLELLLSGGPTQLVLFGTELFGENAEALQVSTVQAWTFPVAGAPSTTTSTTTPAPTTTTPGPTTTTPGPTPTTVDPVTVLLPATGSSDDQNLGLVLVATAVLLLGLAAFVASRREFDRTSPHR